MVKMLTGRTAALNVSDQDRMGIFWYKIIGKKRSWNTFNVSGGLLRARLLHNPTVTRIGLLKTATECQYILHNFQSSLKTHTSGPHGMNTFLEPSWHDYSDARRRPSSCLRKDSSTARGFEPWPGENHIRQLLYEDIIDKLSGYHAMLFFHQYQTNEAM